MTKLLCTLLLSTALAACTSTVVEPTASNSETVLTENKTTALPDSGYHTDSIKLVEPSIPFASFDEWVADLKSNNRSAQFADKFAQRMDADKTDRLLQNTESHWMEYQSDGLKISGVMAWPKNWQGGKLPVVIFNRGGNFKHNVSRIQLTRLLLPIAEQGYLVLASNYRGSKYSEGKDEFGGADVHDVLRLIEIAKTIPNANADKIALFGWSRGVMMSWQTMRQNKTDIDAVIMGAGVVEQESHVKRRPEMARLMAHMVPNFELNRAEELKKRSAIKWMDELNSEVPVLLLHGDKDWRVDVAQSQLAANRLEELNHPHELVIYPGGDHGLSKHKQDVEQRILSFLNSHLK